MASIISVRGSGAALFISSDILRLLRYALSLPRANPYTLIRIAMLHTFHNRKVEATLASHLTVGYSTGVVTVSDEC